MLFPDEFSRIVNEALPPPSSLIETERRILGYDHLEIGGKAAQHWNLPVAIQKCIEHHETPPEPGASKSLELLIYTANLLIIMTEEQSAESDLDEHQPIHAALAILNISTDQAVNCTDSGRQFADQLVTLF
jgi:HD-like signal output (HDOD) protein